MAQSETTSALSDRALTLIKTWLDVDAETLRSAVFDSQHESFTRAKSAQSEAVKTAARQLSVPTGSRFFIQSRLVERFFQSYSVALSAHGGVPGRSIKTHALTHLPKARHVLAIDIQNAYSAISFAQVQRIWTKRLKGGLTLERINSDLRNEIARLLAELCCFRGSLPQGSPTSASLFNLALKPLDRSLERMTREFLGETGRYSRFLDDLVFSTETAIGVDFEPEVRRLVRVHNLGQLNRQKTRFMRRELGETIEISGLSHNGRHLELSARRRNDLETQLQQLFKTQGQDWEAKFAGLMRYAESVYGVKNLPFSLRQLRSQFRSAI